MGLRVNTNLASMTAQRSLSLVTRRLQGNFSRLASGLRIASAADDAAGLGISERMRSQVLSLGQASRNADDGISLVQTAEGALNEVSSNLGRMRELAVQAANGTLSTADRSVINFEFTALKAEIERIANTTEFNGISLLNGTGSINIQVGLAASQTIAVNTTDTTNSSLGINTLSATTVSNSTASLATIDAAINTVSTTRGALGASQNRLASTVRSILNSRENLTSAESRIRDVDVAEETADLTRNSIMQQASVSVLSQANVQPQIALSLLQQ